MNSLVFYLILISYFIFNSIAKNSLVVGGDGRYLNKEVIYKIIGIACANGVDELYIGS
jgi:phosphoglucomutase